MLPSINLFSNLILPLIFSSITTWFCILILGKVAAIFNLIDKPDIRKNHIGNVPLIGGIAMFFGVAVGIIVSDYEFNQYLYFFLGSLIIVSMGVVDDQKNISIFFRITIQFIVATVIVVYGGNIILSLGNLLGTGSINIVQWTYIAYLLSIVAIITGMNSVNMTDGMHGLAGGNSLITFVGMAFLANGNLFAADYLILLLFCAVLPVFLIHNLCIGVDKSKRIFMGDGGSMFIGFSIAWFLINLSQGEDRSFAPVTALWLFGVPLMEITTIFFRRLVSGKSPFQADLNHTHHLLLGLGFDSKRTLLIILLVSLLMALIGILGEIFNVQEKFMFYGFLFVFLMYSFFYKVSINLN